MKKLFFLLLLIPFFSISQVAVQKRLGTSLPGYYLDIALG